MKSTTFFMDLQTLCYKKCDCVNEVICDLSFVGVFINLSFLFYSGLGVLNVSFINISVPGLVP